MKRLALVVLVVMSGCGGGSGGLGGGEGGGAAGGGVGGGGGAAGGGVGGGAGGGAGGGGGSTSAALTVTECEADMQKLVSAGCSDSSSWNMAKTSTCPKIPNVQGALCDGPLTRARQCHAQFQQASIGCVLGFTDTTDPCAVDVVMGVLCVAAMNHNLCVSTPCTSSLDCGTGYNCNDRTKRCFNNSANCLGLPCSSSLHCPTGQTCNSAAGQCVKN